MEIWEGGAVAVNLNFWREEGERGAEGRPMTGRVWPISRFASYDIFMDGLLLLAKNERTALAAAGLLLASWDSSSRFFRSF